MFGTIAGDQKLKVLEQVDWGRAIESNSTENGNEMII